VLIYIKCIGRPPVFSSPMYVAYILSRVSVTKDGVRIGNWIY
jgi:hypothetical protein